MRLRLLALVVVVAVAATACGNDSGSGDDSESGNDSGSGDDSESGNEFESAFPPAPAVPDGPLADDLVTDLDAVFSTLRGPVDLEAVHRLGQSGDARVAWLLSDILRFLAGGELSDITISSWEALTGVTIERTPSPWGFTTDHLIAWDLPAPPGYIDWKRQVFELVEPRWEPLFDDPDATIDWRWVSWGGVRIDDRPLDQTDSACPTGCIPAIDDPTLTSATDGEWYPDDAIVFGVVIGDEAVAFPKNIMEVHEMVNLTIGGRRLGIPYCTLCGSAQAYFTDDVAAGIDLGGPDTYELRTSGLLSRSNKVMFELHTMSVFDTFTGEAVTGPLRAAGVVLDQATVRTSTWGDWKAANPDTLIVAEDGGIGRTYALDPLGGRDDNGPIFPIGDVDSRLGVQDPVVGVVLHDGTALAFPVDLALAVLDAGDDVALAGVRLESDGAGLTAFDAESGEPIAAHQAFWFAWSQFHPTTQLWSP